MNGSNLWSMRGYDELGDERDRSSSKRVCDCGQKKLKVMGSLKERKATEDEGQTPCPYGW